MRKKTENFLPLICKYGPFFYTPHNRVSLPSYPTYSFIMLGFHLSYKRYLAVGQTRHSVFAGRNNELVLLFRPAKTGPHPIWLIKQIIYKLLRHYMVAW